ncbi:MAG: CBS domain-containing protein [Myxococcales bacterium]|nr:MAG: CBS domain-containing protein [Myxococcales bacterium]
MINSDMQVQRYMTKDVQTIGDQQPMLMAHRLMRQEQVKHLPVLHQGKLVGILSDRDLNLFESLSAVDPKLVSVSEAMTDAYVVTPETSLDEVVSRMAEKTCDAAVVCDKQHKVVGIFTTVDVCVAFATLLRSRP